MQDDVINTFCEIKTHHSPTPSIHRPGAHLHSQWYVRSGSPDSPPFSDFWFLTTTGSGENDGTGQEYLAHKKQQPRWDHRGALGIFLLQGTRGRQYLMGEAPLYASAFPLIPHSPDAPPSHAIQRGPTSALTLHTAPSNPSGMDRFVSESQGGAKAVEQCPSLLEWRFFL